MNNNNNNTPASWSNNNTEQTGIFVQAPWTGTPSSNNDEGWGPAPTHIPTLQEGGWQYEPMDIDDEWEDQRTASPKSTFTRTSTKDDAEIAFEKINSFLNEDLGTITTLINEYSQATPLLEMRELINQKLIQLAGRTNRLVAKCRVHPHPYLTDDQVRAIIINIILRNTFTWIPTNLYCKDCCLTMFGRHDTST
ncbi:hypothetical protein BDB00DRAFT_855168 [Zychaea mexicana]|uniref:uncharacterized protein n=1 Tax=Zychaea mexicana TaxID=64656 RepID=UPI0022FF0113|nr:uncharacterized protein BDB00DRAFT_858302 [Zychaea mexicana]XP_052973555.1 uncharacterized protein BDB00DRAFT_855168 [Zychaea mexicana]KAI9479585.1 hypothetical protein BDB00DRAFT_858302 [Zychaea mexicana]KAI9484542.1 hypothetical protein BDB00DRAFT_855168 [Zychaea mexicana]